MTGGSTHEKNIKLFSKDQTKFLGDILKGETKAGKQAYSDLLQRPSTPNLDKMLGPSRQTFQGLMNQGSDMGAFQQGVVDPMTQQYRQQILPALQQRFVDANAGSSSALNQALAQSANDLTTQMGSLYLPFRQNQQQTQLSAAQGYAGLTNPYMSLYGTQMGGRQAALSGLSGLAGQQTFTPLISQKEGILGPMIGAAGSIGAGMALASSEKVKENIKEYSKGLDVIKDLSVKMYDYKKEQGGAKNKVGVIAEKLPKEITCDLDGVLGVDLYGLVGLLINSVKELNKKIDELEKRV
jgi:hypothetical protein